ncbi:CPBP family intramembrane glutamic endopeptidase [Ekhidna sp.]|uniref:CPBP family intramembrane glutamic endopeptidase n=1 Tax=Ekhidna sp. TaxID=2608089 RepID=UPI0032EBF578
MNKLKQLSNKGWQFVGLTIVLSTIPYFFIISDGDAGSNWTLLLMWMPGLAAIILRLVHKEGLFSNLVWNPLKGWKWILLAAFIPFTIEILTIILSVLTGAAQLREGFISMEDGKVALKGMAMLLGASAQPWYVFIPNFILSYFVGMLLYSLFIALGEEFGWRGYLQKEWASTNSLFGFVMIGVIWGWWHLPGILLGHNYPDYPILGGIVLMPMVTILFSIAFGVAFNKQRVIWVPVIFHGAVNISAEISNVGLVEETMNRPLNDVIWTGLWVVATLVVWVKRR